jgi:hypothetical protein
MDRRLQNLVSVGPATMKDLHRLGIFSVHDLIGCDAYELYKQLSELDGVAHDPCVIDVFACAIAQARDPLLPDEQKKWWYWSRVRKNNR